MRAAYTLGVMTEPVKYPRTWHLPWSESESSDDVWLTDTKHFEGKEVVVTEKLDGECVDGDTLISTPNGDKSIKNVTTGDYVLCCDEDGHIQSSIVEDCFENETENQWYEIETETGEIIRLTESHRVFLPKLNCYREVKYLTDEDVFVIMD
jgi:hypothetical protein